MKVSELGEFGLIERLQAVLASRPGVASADRLAVGIGDDAAVWLNGPSGSSATVATTDTLVAGVHFLPERSSWADVGWKAIAVNVSDIAAMGATPEFALLTLGLPLESDIEPLEELYGGAADACAAFGVVAAGGDIVRAADVFITVALCGRAMLDSTSAPLVLRRDAAQPGDVIAVTGSLGGSAGGLRALQDGRAAIAQALVERHMHPRPRVEAGAAALEAGVRCAIDVSDGLLQDLGHVCIASGVGAVVRQDDVPVDPALLETYDDATAFAFAVSGGEDYELLFAAPQAAIDTLRAKIGPSLTVIGEVIADDERNVQLLDANGNAIEVGAAGFDHLRSAG